MCRSRIGYRLRTQNREQSSENVPDSYVQLQFNGQISSFPSIQDLSEALLLLFVSFCSIVVPHSGDVMMMGNWDMFCSDSNMDVWHLLFALKDTPNKNFLFVLVTQHAWKVIYAIVCKSKLIIFIVWSVWKFFIEYKIHSLVL